MSGVCVVVNVIAFPDRQTDGDKQTAKSGILAALDIGSSKISCMIGELRGPKARGQSDLRSNLRVIGFGQTASRGIKSGAVVDVAEAECAIRLAVDAAERNAHVSIHSITVALSGGRPATSTHTGRVVTQTGIVSPRDVEAALVQALGHADTQGRPILHLHPVNHSLDNVTGIGQPLGLHGAELQADIGITTVDPAYLRNIALAVGRAHLEPSNFVLASYAAGKSALTADERALGSVVIEIGGSVTSIAFIRHDKLVAAESFNMGGQLLTHDVAHGLSTSIAHAERMKTLFGTAIEGGHAEQEMLAVPLLGEKGTDSVQRVAKAFLTRILVARLEEIFEHCAKRLASPVFAQSAGARVVLTGGGSLMPGLAELAARVLNRTVRVGFSAALNGMSEHHRHAGFTVLSGALLHAARPDAHYALPEKAKNALAEAHMGYARRLGRWLAEAL